MGAKKTAKTRVSRAGQPEAGGRYDVEDQLAAQNEELRLAQNELEQSRNSYAELYDCAPVGYLTVDHAGRILEVNLTGAAMLGRSREALIGSLLSAFPANRGERLKLSAHLRLCRGGAARVVTRLELQCLNSSTPAQMVAELVSTPRPGPGKPCFFTVLTDRTAQVQAERAAREHRDALSRLNAELEQRVCERTEALSQSEMLKEAVFRSIRAHLVILDARGEILGANRGGEPVPAWFSPRRAPGNASNNYLELCRLAALEARDGAAQAAEGVEAVLKGRLPHFHLEYCHHELPSTDRWISLTVTPLASGAGAVLSHEDISERKHLERQILEISEAERRLIGLELHDGLCQHLSGTALMAAALARTLSEPSERLRAAEISRFLSTAVDLTRQVARGLHPVEIDAQGLVSALQELSREVAKRVPCELHCRSDFDVGDSAVAVNLYRIAQEAIANSLKHANPTRIVVRLTRQRDCLVMTIEDNGNGLLPASGQAMGLGMNIMKYRASSLGANFDAANLPEGGVRVRCSLHLKQPKAKLTRQYL